MSRSSWKPVYISKELANMISNDDDEIKLFHKNSILIPSHVNRIFYVYNGMKFVKINVKKEMLGHKIGEFVPTRKRHIFKGKKDKNQNKKKK